MDWSLPGSSVHGILQARILEWLPCLLQGIFWTQRLQLHHVFCICRRVFCCWHHLGSPISHFKHNFFSHFPKQNITIEDERDLSCAHLKTLGWISVTNNKLMGKKHAYWCDLSSVWQEPPLGNEDQKKWLSLSAFMGGLMKSRKLGKIWQDKTA